METKLELTDGVNYLFSDFNSDFNIARCIKPEFCINDVGQFIYVNSAMSCLIEYSRDELLYMKLIDITIDDLSSKWDKLWQHLQKDNSITLLSQYQTKTNRIISVEVSICYVARNGIEFGCAFVNDKAILYKL